MTQPTRMRAWDIPKDAEVCLWKDAYKCISELTAERDKLGAAAVAYQDLAVCYRVGRGPSEKLFKALGKAQEAIKAWKEAKP